MIRCPLEQVKGNHPGEECEGNLGSGGDSQTEEEEREGEEKGGRGMRRGKEAVTETLRRNEAVLPLVTGPRKTSQW